MPHHGKVSFQTSWLQKEDEDGHKIGTWCQKDSDSNAFCVICNKSFSISNSGFSQIKQHFKGERHKSEARCKTGKNVSHLSFTKVVETSSEAPSTSGPKQLTLQSAIADQATSAEILWMLKVSQSDYSLSSCDGLPKLFKKMFPCPASEEFTLSRTKASYMMSDGIGLLVLKLLVDDLKRSETAITLMYDETTTVQVKKQMDVLVRYWSEAEQRVTVRFLKALFFGHAKGVDVGSEIMKLFNLSSDGPNVNKTIWHFIDEKLKEKKFKGLIPMIPCNVHIIHNGFRQGLSSYGQDAENLAFDLHAWFKRSPCKREDYLEIQEECQLDDSLFVRHVPTRWCTLMGALERILKKWKAITKYFLEFLPQDAKKQRTEKLLDQNDKYKAICLKLKTYELKVCAQISFLVSVAPIFNRFLKLFQTEGPLVHILHHELKEILYALMGRFMKPDSYKEKSASDLATVDVEKVENLLPVEQVEIGEPTEDFLKKLDSHSAAGNSSRQDLSTPNNLNNVTIHTGTESPPNNSDNTTIHTGIESPPNNSDNTTIHTGIESPPNNSDNTTIHTGIESPPNNSDNTTIHTGIESPPNNSDNTTIHTGIESPPNNSDNTTIHTGIESPPNNSDNTTIHTGTESPPNNSDNTTIHTGTESPPNNSDNTTIHTGTESPPNNSDNTTIHTGIESPQNNSENSPNQIGGKEKRSQNIKTTQKEGQTLSKDWESRLNNYSTIQILIMQLVLSSSVSVFISFGLTYWWTSKTIEILPTCEEKYNPGKNLNIPDVNVTALFEERFSDLNITKLKELYNKTGFSGVNLTVYEERISSLESSLEEYKKNYSVIQDELGNCTAMKQEVQTNFSHVVLNYTELKDDVEKGQSFMYGLKGRLDFADYSNMSPEYIFIIMVILGLGEVIIGFLFIRMMMKWKQTMGPSRHDTTQANDNSLQRSSYPEKLQFKTDGAQKSVLDRISKCNLKSKICVIGFDKERLQTHKSMIERIIPVKFGIEAKLINTNEDITDIPKSKVMIVFVNSNPRHIILEGKHELGDVRITTISGIEKMGARVILVYIGDTIAKEIGQQELWSGKLGSAAKHPTIKKLQEDQCFYSVYQKFSEFQRKQLLEKLDKILQK